MLTHGTGVYTEAQAMTHKCTLRFLLRLLSSFRLLTTVSSPPALLAPNPRGSHSVAGHSHPQLWAESQQLGLRPEGTHIGSREKSERRKKKKKSRHEEARERGKGRGGGWWGSPIT